jgi:preprotein translocase subunit SecA
MKAIQPLVEEVKKIYPQIEALDNDALRARAQELRTQVQSAGGELKQQIAELKAKVEELPLEERSDYFAKIDK